MKQKKKTFSELTKEIAPLTENEQGLLKGGFTELNPPKEDNSLLDNRLCPTINILSC